MVARLDSAGQMKDLSFSLLFHPLLTLHKPLQTANINRYPLQKKSSFKEKRMSAIDIATNRNNSVAIMKNTTYNVQEQ